MKFQEPPSNTKGGKYAYDLAVERLKKRPDTWALVAENCHTQNTAVWQRRGCETRTHKQPDRTFNIYARYPSSKLESDATD